MRKTLDESKMKRNGKIEEIRKNPYNPRNSFFFKLEEYYYRPIKSSNSFSTNYIKYNSNGDKDKTILFKEYLDKIKPYLSNMIDNSMTQGEWKIQLIIFLLKILKCFCSKDSEETRTMHTKSDNIETMIENETEEIIGELFQYLIFLFSRMADKQKSNSKSKKNIYDKCFQYAATVSLNHE